MKTEKNLAATKKAVLASMRSESIKLLATGKRAKNFFPALVFVALAFFFPIISRQEFIRGLDLVQSSVLRNIRVVEEFLLGR